MRVIKNALILFSAFLKKPLWAISIVKKTGMILAADERKIE
jgi:hypothetical protein